mmetsp:Transcript_39596/g.97880  ORF Transcript_39596/g.97880 Transcript_39596/m.97880 type:complete len:201 (+) Transcript_39596:1084-1686(+)
MRARARAQRTRSQICCAQKDSSGSRRSRAPATSGPTPAATSNSPSTPNSPKSTSPISMRPPACALHRARRRGRTCRGRSSCSSALHSRRRNLSSSSTRASCASGKWCFSGGGWFLRSMSQRATPRNPEAAACCLARLGLGRRRAVEELAPSQRDDAEDSGVEVCHAEASARSLVKVFVILGKAFPKSSSCGKQRVAPQSA